MEFREIKYPYEEDSEGENIWYHFGQSEGAIDIQDKEIEQWVNKAIESVKNQLKNGIKSPYSFQASGNTIVICFFNMYNDEDWEDLENDFTVIICKNYKQADISIGDLIKKEKKKLSKKDYSQITLEDLEKLSQEKGTPNLKVGRFTVYIDREED